MLAGTTWVIRLAACVAVGFGMFAGRTAHGGTLAAQVALFALACLFVGAWAVLERRPAGGDRALPVILAALAACSVLTGTTDGGGLVVFAAMAAVGAGARLRLVSGVVITAIGVLVVIGGGVAAGASTAAAVGYPLLLVVCLLTGRNRQNYRVQAEQSAAMVRHLQRLRREQQQVVTLDERARIAREIHDVLAHSLGALGIQIQAARALLADSGDVPRALAALDGAQRMATDGLTETRRAIHALRSDTLPLAAELAQLATTHRERHHSTVEVRTPGGNDLAPDATVALLRVAQEALVNAAKHAPGQPVTLALEDADRRTVLTVSQPLTRPVPPVNGGSTTGGYGLIGMRERLLLLGGSLDARPTDGHWSVVATVPR